MHTLVLYPLLILVSNSCYINNILFFFISKKWSASILTITAAVEIVVDLCRKCHVIIISVDRLWALASQYLNPEINILDRNFGNSVTDTIAHNYFLSWTLNISQAFLILKYLKTEIFTNLEIIESNPKMLFNLT